MENLKMHTPDLAAENYKKLAALFPNAVTETITGYDDNGKAIVERAIDADVLRQEIAAQVVEGAQERYQFTWPDKKRSVVLANQPIAKTLRLVREKSVGRDGTPGSIDTENIYIEGDNLDALKLLQETYLGKVKMIFRRIPLSTLQVAVSLMTTEIVLCRILKVMADFIPIGLICFILVSASQKTFLVMMVRFLLASMIMKSETFG